MDSLIEQAVLGGILEHGVLSKPWPPEVMELAAEYFKEPKNAKVWMAIEDLITDRHPVDVVSVAAWLYAHDIKGLSAYLCDLYADCPTSTNLGHWCRILCEDGQKAAIDRQLKEAVAQLGSGATHEDVAARVQDVMRESRDNTGGLVHASQILKEATKEMEDQLEKRTVKTVRTGLREIDAVTELRQGQLTIVAGRPAMGKSALVGGIAGHVSKNSQNGVTALFSLEMRDVDIIRRLLAAEAGIPTADLHRYMGNTEFTEACNEIHTSALYIDDRPNLSIAQMRQALSRMNDVQMVAVDYLQLAGMNQKLDTMDQKIGDVTKGLAAISKDFECHVIGLSQLNRGVESRNPPRPKMSDLRGSGEIEQHADTIMLLYRPHYYGQSGDPSDAEVIVAKSRHGKACAVNVGWNGERQEFYSFRH